MNIAVVVEMFGWWRCYDVVVDVVVVVVVGHSQLPVD